jgi:hypothetical protein
MNGQNAEHRGFAVLWFSSFLSIFHVYWSIRGLSYTGECRKVVEALSAPINILVTVYTFQKTNLWKQINPFTSTF